MLAGGTPTRYGVSFGPTVVDLARIVAALDLGDHAEALTLHRETIDTSAFRELPVEHRAAHLVDVAGRCVRLGDLPEAEHALLLAHRTAPAEVRHRRAAHRALRVLARRSPRPAPEITRLAEALRVTL
ncbi:hypothetical protein O7606_07025 [Micromonospora sp. WMMD882]|uniref:hypothetical protein n=1 Tax=Micromonospora sp. WMMD882 TaxID=3015151 RepID=UPI00248A9C48|nr:hypothetical protein [Micromonospora sp. WMMD882]WBB81125.1 hypothetical protein O7606_07025 [Micromonospora sp. WMMD882]